MRTTKIVCTLGPATATAPRLAELIDAGMDVARLNFSHATHAEHSALYDLVREIAASRGRAVQVLQTCRDPRSGWADSPMDRWSGVPVRKCRSPPTLARVITTGSLPPTVVFRQM